MRRILIISSYVARDAVGITANTIPLQAAGIEVVALPTVVLSNHPVRARMAGMTLEASLLEDMLSAIEHNGWLGTFDAIFSGYLPTARHVEVVGRVVKRMREISPSTVFVCDPIFGDDPGGLYIDAVAAAAIRDTLLPITDILTPNRFELAWLSGIDVRTPSDAIGAASLLARPIVVGTSIPDEDCQLATVLVAGRDVYVGRVKKLEDVPHGTGDVFAACLTAKLLLGETASDTLGYAVAGVKQALEASRGSDHLLLHLVDWANGIRPVRVELLA